MSEITDLGSGTPGYVLVIEGWPEVFRSSSRITRSGSLDGRTMVSGLSYAGLLLTDRIVFQEARCDGGAMTFKVIPEEGEDVLNGDGEFTDPVTASLSTYPDPITELAAPGIDSTDVSIAIVAGGSLADGVYHIDTEAIEVDTFPTVVRTKWDTLAQEHKPDYLDKSRTIYIYDRPPTMEARRAYLYRYDLTDTQESLTGDGELIWRGIVSRNPRLDSDGLTWLIECLPITHLLRQTVGGKLTDAGIVGLYHHAYAAFGVRVYFDGDWSTALYVTGLYTETSLIAAVNTAFADALTELGADTAFGSIQLYISSDKVWGISLHTGTGSTNSELRVIAGSIICGFVFTGFNTPFRDTWISTATNFAHSGDEQVPGEAYNWVDGDEYRTELTFDDKYFNIPLSEISPFTYAMSPEHVSPLGRPNTLISGARIPDVVFAPGWFNEHFVDGSAAGTSPMWRVHLDKDFADADAVQIPNTGDEDWQYAIEDDGSTDGVSWILVEPFVAIRPRPFAKRFAGFLTVDTVVTPIREYASSGSVVAFVGGLKTKSIFANDGVSPFITDADFTDWDAAEALSLFSSPLVPGVTDRSYLFTTEIELAKILQEDLKLSARCMRIGSDGRIDLISMPNFTEAQIVPSSHRITGADIVTPASGYGAWPTAEPQRDGVITSVTIQDSYEPHENTWTGEPVTYVDTFAVATNKMRGKNQTEIKPYSKYVGVPGQEGFEVVAARYLSLVSRDYIVITLAVSFRLQPILCGDVVSLTYARLPNGSGGRGFTSRRAFVIDRRWPLDPKDGSHGWLTLWMPARPLYGYCPSAFITAQADQGGDVWNITCNVANDLNIQLSTNADGECLEHFQNGDFVMVVRRDQDSPTIVFGTISGTPNAAAGTCTVEFDATWTPGAFTWTLEFQAPAESLAISDHQTTFAYVGDGDQLLTDGSFARRFS